jgi:alanyl-tRNA synthetase
MKTTAIRQAFIEFFENKHHQMVPSSSLVPGNDPTLLFTNAGMVQFKDVFLGKEKRSYTRATSSQRCVRAGGKHNDLENVGYTARHHTFFEMLGNFSFGDYFKREAIQFAWEFLTQVLKIPANKLWITVFENDDEAADIWLKEMKVDPQRFSRCGVADNFWSMGDTGPCGPCTEIFYDHGAEIPGGPPGTKDADGDRYIEIWNLVFMQFNRAADGSMTPLPKPSVDTGMGLERIAAVMQGVHSNYEIDIFQHLIKAIAKIAKHADTNNISLRVIADHIRSSSFLIVDGILPANEGRGYVLRRIIRRAIRHGHKLGLTEPFFYKLVAPLVEVMSDAYPELIKSQKQIEKVLQQEEQQFALTLTQGIKIFEQEVAQLKNKIIPGEIVFRLYDTYGFPPDLTNDIARERGLTLDYLGFDHAMAKQRELSQQSSKFEVDYNTHIPFSGETEFTGYDSFTDKAKVVALFSENKLVDTMSAGTRGAVILDRTPFYAESGGQVGDKGRLIFENGIFHVYDTQKQGLVHVHYGKVEQGTLRVNANVSAEVDSARQATMLNHTATHLLHAALRRILGDHVIQKGSLVAPDRLRFDFSHTAALTAKEISAVEHLVNQQIRANLTGHIEVMSPQQAQKKGAMALFGEKYGEKVRVLSIGEFSMELCGGTHVGRTGDIGLFKIIGETGVAAGVRRIEALTGEAALQWVDNTEKQMQTAQNLLKANRDNVNEKLQQQMSQLRLLEKEIERLQQKLSQSQSGDLTAQAVDIKGIKVLIAQVNDMDVKVLRNTVDQLKDQLKQAVVLLANVKDNSIQIIGGVSKSCNDKLSANELVDHVAQQVGGKGGGRPDMAQGGGQDVAALPAALKSAKEWVQKKLQ